MWYPNIHHDTIKNLLFDYLSCLVLILVLLYFSGDKKKLVEDENKSKVSGRATWFKTIILATWFKTIILAGANPHLPIIGYLDLDLFNSRFIG